MKFVIKYLFIGMVVNISLTSFSQTHLFSLNIKEKTVKDVFREIEIRSSYIFFYFDDALDINRIVSLTVKEKTIAEVLNKLFESTDNTFVIQDRQIFITQKKPEENLLNQRRSKYIYISGIVHDNNMPLIGVNIKIKNTGEGTITNTDGCFELEAPSDAVLIFSYMGYKTKEVQISKQEYINCMLEADELGLAEVIVVGYGQAHRGSLTGAIASVKGDKLREISSSNTVNALQGRAAGVSVLMQSAKPGEEANIRIRGNRSLNALNTPLFVIDGIPVSGGISELSTADIESIEILKDASATAIYGSRGANGVILITTKKGVAGKTQIEFNSYFGVQNATRTIEMMNGGEWVELIREANRATTKNTPYPLIPSLDWDRKIGYFMAEPDILNKIGCGYNNTGKWVPEKVPYVDWTKETLQTSPIQNYQLSIKGGNEKIKLLASSVYFNQKGIVKGQSFSRYSIRFNFDWYLNKRVLLGGRSLFSHAISNTSDNLYSSVKNVSPLADVYTEDGNYTTNRPVGDPQLWNYFLDLDNMKKEYRRDRLLNSFYLDIQLPYGLNYRSNFGLDITNRREPEFYGSLSSDRADSPARAVDRQKNRRMYVWENLLFWDKMINQRHSLNLTFLQSIQQDVVESSELKVKDLPYESQLWHNVGTAYTIESVSSNYSSWKLASFMGRFNYSIRDKYLLTLSTRYDGSSRLAPKHKWVMFPSVAVAWKIDKESLFDKVNFLNEFKLRLGYGVTGNTSINPYKTQGNLAMERYSYGSDGVLAFYQHEMPNSFLSWEKTRQLNFGIDFSFLGRRISGVFDVYKQTTRDLLMDRQLPVVSGFSSVIANIGEIENNGIELSVSTVNITHSNFHWMSDLILTTNKERITRLYNGKVNDEGNGWFIGKPVNVFYDYKADGIWQLEDQAELEKWNGSFSPGDIKVIDKNNDYKITSEDRFLLGQAEPKLTLSLSNYFSYKNIDFNFFIYGAFGQMKTFDRNWSLNGRYNGAKVNYWKITGVNDLGNPISNKSNEAPRPNIDYENPNYMSSLYYLKSSFLRIGQITMGYTFPNQWMDRWGKIERVRLYATVQNLHVFTKYPGTDPETGSDFNEPRPRSFIIGLNMSF